MHVIIQLLHIWHYIVVQAPTVKILQILSTPPFSRYKGTVWTIYTHGVIGEVETAVAKGTQVKAIKTTMGKAVKLRFRYKRLTDKVKWEITRGLN